MRFATAHTAGQRAAVQRAIPNALVHATASTPTERRCSPGQFDERGRPREVIAQVIAAFGPKLRGWELGLWFTSANAWLEAALPVDKLGDALGEVVPATTRLAEKILAA